MAVPSTRADLVPPVGAGAGLPLTLVWADDLTDAGGTGTEGYALFDTNLWKTAAEARTTPSVPEVVAGALSSHVHTTLLDFSHLNWLGLTVETEAPRLNYGNGRLEHGQAIQDVGFGRHSASDQRSFAPAVTATVTEVGRHVEHPKRTHTSARPANHTWMQARHALNRGIPSYDLQIGSVIDGDIGSIGTVEAFTHRATTDLPSNGIGATYGDSHNSGYLSSLWSCPLSSMAPQTGFDLAESKTSESKAYSSHWGMNLMVNQEVMVSGVPLSSPDGLNTAVLHGLTDYDSLNLPAETVQTINVSDIFTETGMPTQEETLFPLGSIAQGNHVVADTCGLVGYEGVLSATAFVAVSRNANAPFVQAPPASPLVPATAWNENGAGLYAGINIQVHSGLSMRRNGLSWSTPEAPLFQYGSDGSYVEPMTEGMSTSGSRSGFKGALFNDQGNKSRFHTGRSNHHTTGGAMNNLNNTTFNEVAVGGPANPTVKATSKGASRYIVGDTHTSGAWTATLNLSQEFMKDKVPTKVKVVPTLIGYDEVSVAAGASHPSSSPITFKRPIVDYHVMVSLAPATRINATVDLTNTTIGTPTARNFPQSRRLTANMNLEDEGCEIYHAVFRVSPNTLERVFFDPTSASVTPWGIKATDAEMPNTVMPRHDSENGGWGLHQLTPFRPIANASWAQVPLLCAAIEAGGFYQRGGVSHLWDADTYGSELFVSADIIDANHLSATVFGNGQVWADGVGALAVPRGSELLIFKYRPQVDSYHLSKYTTPTDNPLYSMASTIIGAPTGAVVQATAAHKQYEGWEVHDWVFPQIELMRYLGREDKSAAMHPRHSANTGADPIFHPTIHCSSLRFMEDGRMAMAAIQRDHIGSEEEYPSSDIQYPFNPDSGSGSGCPPGYYRSGDICVPITSGDNPNTESEHVDPITGEVIVGPPPTPGNGNGEGHVGGGDNFDLTPAWSRIVANTSARSLVLMWSDAKAVDGKAKGGRALFEAEKQTIDGGDYYTQNWTYNDTWWSGSRISYWYSESGQRAIPITYGSYPEVRCSFAHLPRSLPHIMTTGIAHGYPLLQPVDRVSVSALRDVTGVDAWAQERYDFLRRTRFVPTTIGFTDFGAGANPHQEMGWAGWSFPQGLYDPIGFGDNTVFFSDAPESLAVADGVAIVPTLQAQWSGFASSAAFGHMRGPMTAFSHHGPLHYGIATQDHPFKADRVWKQVHGGVGYDIPLHLLAPAEVAVRARAGGRNSLDLEMETPFHRTDTLHLDGAALFNTGFDEGGKDTPESARTELGQYHLRTNLWTDDSRFPGAKTGGLLTTDRVRGPTVAGNGLEAFWNDHPTEHFHAGAIPLMPGSDYDLTAIENERYAPSILGRIQELSELDYVAVAEQLQSSVDVHVSQVTRPMWDSGSIVSGRGTGFRDSTTSANVSQVRSEMDGADVPTAVESKTAHDNGMGKGQRLLRTPEGTLHMFPIERSAQSLSNNLPRFVHYTKPLHGDLFWNRKALKVNPSAAAYDGKDEVGYFLGSGDKLRSATFASDSEGTIHAVVEVETSVSTPSHLLYYHYAKRKLVSYNPTPVYEWDWTEHTAVVIGGPTFDLRQPSIVCDSNDRLHLTCRYIATNKSHIVYTTKLQTDTSFSSPPPFEEEPAEWTTDIWTKVNKSTSNPVAASDNQDSSTSHAVIDCDNPKVCLLGDDTPIVFYRGASAGASVLGNRANDAIYVNVGRNDVGSFDPAGRYRFDYTKSMHCVGVHGTAQYPATKVIYYDAIVDERNRAFVTVVKDDSGRSVIMNSFDAGRPLTAQYTTANGLGVTKALFIPKNTNVRPDYKHLTTTTNGKGEVHMILGFTLAGDVEQATAIYRDGVTEATIAPLQWATTPASDSTAVPPAAMSTGGGYEAPTGTYEWPTGGTHLMPSTGPITHFMEVWMPTFEFSQDGAEPDEVLRSINIRWLSVPSMNYEAAKGWYPVGSAQSLNGHEDFTHTNPQLRYQRYWGFDAGELDLQWATNEASWMNTPHGGSRVYFPYAGGSFTTVGEGEIAGDGIAGWPIS
tara:strand:+ start:10058 stop:16162 length:6105 start_codon:yes stop_codon:yes gene_type:complete